MYFEELLMGFSKYGFTKDLLPWMLPTYAWKK